MANVKFGFIGAGQISYSSARELLSHGGAEIVAVADPNEPRVKAMASEFSIGKTYTDPQDLVARSDLDAIYVAVPNKFHAPWAKAALEAGKHVILDKPFALNYAEAEGVAEAATANGKIFMLGMNQRFRKDSQTLRVLASQGHFGDIYHAKAFWFRRTGIPKLGTWFGNKAVSGGGAILDIGVHLLDLALYICDRFDPVAVSGQAYTKFGNRGLGEGGWGMSDRDKDIVFDVEDFATALIKFSDEFTVTLDVSWAIHQEDANRNDVYIYGSEAGARAYPSKTFRYPSQEEITAAEDPEKLKYVVSEAPEVAIPYPHEKRFHNFVNAIKGEEAPCVPVEHALAVQKILDAIYLSSTSGREVRLD